MTGLLFISGIPTKYITSVVILAVSNNILNLAEVTLISQGTEISRSSLEFTLSSTWPDCSWHQQSGPCTASHCNDGLVSTICASLDGGAKLSIQLSVPTPVDQIVIYNRDDCCQDRVNGATVATYLNGAVQWSATIPYTSALSYVFNTGKLLSIQISLFAKHCPCLSWIALS